MVGSVPPRPVADRPGRRAGAFGADAQRLADLDACDAAAAGADLLDVDHRHLHRQAGGIAADQRRAGHQHVALVDHAGLGGGAAHIEGDGVRHADRVAQRLGADHAGGGAGFQHADAGSPRVADVEQPAGRLHDQEVAAEAGVVEMRFHLGEIAAARAGRHRRWRRRSRCARTRDTPGSARARRVTKSCGNSCSMISLARFSCAGLRYECRNRIAIGLARPAPPRSAATVRTCVLVERDQHRALGVDPLHDLEAQVAVDQRHVLAGKTGCRTSGRLTRPIS